MPSPLKSMIKQDTEEKVMKVPKGNPYLEPEVAQEIALQLIKDKHVLRSFEHERSEGYRSQTVSISLDGGYDIEIKKVLYDEFL